MQATTPKDVLIPVGTNSYGHPTPEVLDRITAAGATAYRTDLHGDITVTVTDAGYNVTTLKAPAPTGTTSTTSTTTTVVPPPSTSLSIGHIEFDAAGTPDDGNNAHLEWVEICNGGTDQSMSGWRLRDSTSTNVYDFPSAYVLPGGSCVNVRTGQGTNSATDLYWGRSQHVWNQDHDTARLFNGSTLVASKSY